ncbi:hypothetical protein SAMN05444392_12430 [Seinonella peptonophila]|uniref:Uncharacterized protein n=2 Tax=Seinonella peptonophila TaxID=112248 RepID=A0A1M5BJ13_9BACL|nr:hypothetical protein SAMN05444392_12430 [Seinonella peptonophila]
MTDGKKLENVERGIQPDIANHRELDFASLIGGTSLNGTTGGKFDEDVKALGLHWGVKTQRGGFRLLNGWLKGSKDALALKADHEEWLVCMPLSTLKELLKNK